MDHANNDQEAPHAAEPAGPIEVTWAMTDSDPAKRQRIGKIWKPKGEGKWPPTPGAKRKSYVFEPTKYPDLEAFAFTADLTARLRAGCFAPVAGRLKLMDTTAARDANYPRDAKHIADQRSWLLVLDFDGLASKTEAASRPGPRIFGDAVLAEMRQRLPPAFKAVRTASWWRQARPACHPTPETSPPTAARASAQYFCCRALCSSPTKNKS